MPIHRDDPSTAQDRLDAILRSPSYGEADRDIALLDTGALRGVRLQLDYLKAETILARDGIAETIVVFGGTHIVDPAVAAARHADLLAQLARDPNNPTLAAQRRTAERAVRYSRYYAIAQSFGASVGRRYIDGGRQGAAIMTGGGPGIMEAANRGAASIGAPSIGLNISLVEIQEPNPYITPHLSFEFHYFAIRKLHLLLRAQALVVFPGGFGTFDELFETLTLVQTRKITPLPIILVGEEYWRQAINFDFLVADGFIAERDLRLFAFAETADEILQRIAAWRAPCATQP